MIDQLSGAASAAVKTVETLSVDQWLLTLLIYTIGLGLAFVIANLISIAIYRPTLTPVELKVKEGFESGVVRLVTATRKKLKLEAGQKLRIWSIGESAGRLQRQSSATATLWQRNDGGPLAPDEIEMPKEMIALLFRNPVGDEVATKLEIAKIELSGFALYWNNPDPQLRFQNRFAVYLSVVLTVISVAIGFAPIVYQG